MNIRQLSDLHLETGPFTWQDQGEDVVVLAGDISVGIAGIEFAKTIKKPVIYVSGNHEHWGQDIYENIAAMRAAAKGSNVHFLENNEVNLTINGEIVRFLGCTLWTDYGQAHCLNHPVLLPPDMNPQHELMRHALGWMRDYSKITAKKWWVPSNTKRYTKILGANSPDNFRFNPLTAYDMHKKSLAWLVAKLEDECPHKTVVVTHHAPSYQSLIQAKMIGDYALNPKQWHASHRDEVGYYRVAAYASDLEKRIGRRSWSGSGVDLWLHGHTHSRIQYAMAGTVVSCNPRGYHKKPLTIEDARSFGFLGYPISDEDITRNQKLFLESPEKGDTQNFERNLVTDMDTMLPELVIRNARELLKELPPILDDVLAHKAYLTRKDELVVSLAGEHIAKQASQFNKATYAVLEYLTNAFKRKDHSYIDDNYWIAVNLGLTENYMGMKSARARKAVVNFSVDSDFRMPEEPIAELVDAGFSGFNVAPVVWGRGVISEMQRTIRAFDKRLFACVEEISKGNGRVKLGAALAAFGQQFGGIEFTAIRDQRPTEPASFE